MRGGVGSERVCTVKGDSGGGGGEGDEERKTEGEGEGRQLVGEIREDGVGKMEDW